MASKIIKALLIEPGEHPKITYLPLSTKVFDAFTGADIDDGKNIYIQISDHIYAVYNVEAALQDLSGNRKIEGRIVAGNILIIETDTSGHIQSLSDDVLLKFQSIFWHPETYSSLEVCRSYFNFFYHSFDEPEFS